MKMSDVFELPVTDVDVHEDCYASMLDCKAAAHAINCHDGLVDAVEVLLLHAELADRQAISELLARAKGVL